MKKQVLLSFTLLLCSLSLAAQWQHIPGPEGGHVINLDTDGSQLYALTTTNIFRSDDEGYHWQVLEGSHHAGRTIGRLVAENGVFYGKNTDGEVLRSNDGGKTWKVVLKKPYPITAPGEVLHEVFAKGDTVLVSSEFTIYRSVDRGETWAATSDLFSYGHANIFSAGSDLFAWSKRHIHRSSDGGQTWKRVFTSGGEFAAVGLANEYLYAFYTSTGRVLRSDDGFDTWETIESAQLNYLGKPYQVVGDGALVYCINQDYYCGGYFVYSIDKGLTWLQGQSEIDVPLTVRGVISFGGHLILAHKKGVSHSIDHLKTIVHTQQNGLDACYIENISVGKHSVGVDANSISYLSDKTGQNWMEVALDPSLNPCYRWTHIHNTEQRWFLMDQQKKTTFYSDNEGKHWTQLDKYFYDIQVTTKHCLWEIEPYQKTIRRLSDDKKEFTTLYGIGALYRNLFGFEHHVIAKVEDCYELYEEHDFVGSRISCSPCNAGGVLHFDGHNLFHFCGSNTYVFKENATDWEEIYPQDWATGIPLYHSRITDLKTHDGVTWAALEGKGLFYTTDATGRFYPAQPQLPYPYPTALAFRGDTIWVGTEGGGIYRMTLPPVHTEASAKPIFQCSPNPSNGRLRLEADVFFTDETRLAVLDVTGKMVTEKKLAPGQVWDLDFHYLPRGLYVLMLRTASGSVGLKWAVH